MPGPWTGHSQPPDWQTAGYHTGTLAQTSSNWRKPYITLQNTTYRCGLCPITPSSLGPALVAAAAAKHSIYTAAAAATHDGLPARDLTGLHHKKHSQPAFSTLCVGCPLIQCLLGSPGWVHFQHLATTTTLLAMLHTDFTVNQPISNSFRMK